VIAPDRFTVTVLRRHNATTALEGHGGGFVFTTTRGHPIKPDRLGELFDLVGRLGIEPRTQGLRVRR
jgi:hypothetical protein